jgi:hypothetical protein
MPELSDASRRVLHEIESRLCSGNKALRERAWWMLVRTLRRQKLKIHDARSAVTELLSVTGGRGVPPQQSLWDEYCGLSEGARGAIDNRYRECLEAARREFPYVFHIDVINVPAKMADFRFAAESGEGLPGLNENQRSIARIFGIPEEKYQLEIQAKLYGEERYRLFAERFWDLVMQAGEPYALESAEVVYDVAAGKFYCELNCDGITRRAAFAAEVISAPIERGDREGILAAQEAVKVWLEEVLGRLTPARP